MLIWWSTERKRCWLCIVIPHSLIFTGWNETSEPRCRPHRLVSSTEPCSRFDILACEQRQSCDISNPETTQSPTADTSGGKRISSTEKRLISHCFLGWRSRWRRDSAHMSTTALPLSSAPVHYEVLEQALLMDTQRRHLHCTQSDIRHSQSGRLSLFYNYKVLYTLAQRRRTVWTLSTANMEPPTQTL